MDVDHLNRRAEAYLLLLAATLGMCLMASAADLVMVYLAIETTSIPLYLLAGFLKDDEKSTESGFKYLLFGALTSTVMLYGFSLVYGFSGTTSLYQLNLHFGSFDLLTIGVVFLVLAGLAFKVSLFPFHFWAPDVYEGAPTPVAGFLSTASKAAGFAVILRLFLAAFSVQEISANLGLILAVLATLTMTVGNLIALTQKNIKRLLAYSSIAHAGYAMIGVVAFSQLGAASTVFYLLAYILTNLAAFGIVAAAGKVTGSDELESYRGLSRRNATLALAMLSGVPVPGWDAALRRFRRQGFRLRRGGRERLGLAGGGRRAELHRRPLLLPERPEIRLPLPHGKRGRRQASAGGDAPVCPRPGSIDRRHHRGRRDLCPLVLSGERRGFNLVLDVTKTLMI